MSSPSCIIYCLSRVGKRLFVFTCSHFKFVVQSFIFYRKESDSRWSRYFVAASLFIPSCWTSQVICWRFQWRCFRWADSDFTDLQKHNCVDRNRRPAMTFFEKKQASKSKQDGGRILYSTLLYSFGITRQDPGMCLRAVIAWTWGTLNCSEPSCMMNSKWLSMWMMTWSLDRRLDKKSSAARGKLLRSADQGCSTPIISTLKEWICLSVNDLVFG